MTLRFDGPLGAAVRAWGALGVEVAPPPGPALAPGDPSWGPVAYRYRVGAGRWSELRVVHDGTAGLATTGVVVLTVPPAGAGTGTAELRLAFDRGFFPVPPQIRAAAINVLPVVQLRREAPAPLVPAGTGQPDQVVPLDTTDLVGPALQIQVAGETWQERTDLDRSGPGDPHYVLHPDHVLFGNGVNGRRPGRDAEIRHTGPSRTAGAAGNLRPGLPWIVPALGPSAYGRNRQALAGGADRTADDELARAARKAAVGRAALLTDGDLRDAALRLGGLAVGRAEVVARFDRRLGERRIDGVRTLVVLPHQPPWTRDGEPPDLVRPSQAYLHRVATVTVPAVLRVASVRVGRAGGPLGTDPVAVPPDGLVVAGAVAVDAVPTGAGGPVR